MITKDFERNHLRSNPSSTNHRGSPCPRLHTKSLLTTRRQIKDRMDQRANKHECREEEMFELSNSPLHIK